MPARAGIPPGRTVTRLLAGALAGLHLVEGVVGPAVDVPADRPQVVEPGDVDLLELGLAGVRRVVVHRRSIQEDRLDLDVLALGVLDGNGLDLRRLAVEGFERQLDARATDGGRVVDREALEARVL